MVVMAATSQYGLVGSPSFDYLVNAVYLELQVLPLPVVQVAFHRVDCVSNLAQVLQTNTYNPLLFHFSSSLSCVLPLRSPQKGDTCGGDGSVGGPCQPPNHPMRSKQWEIYSTDDRLPVGWREV
jgi:hypothetical protein